MIYDFIQSDYRWANHPYADETMAVAGCGPTSVADVTGVLPPDVADYMTSRGWASHGQGTYWHGIAPAAEHYGFASQQLNTSSLYGVAGSDIERAWLNKMKSGKYYGILLMGPGYFCTTGHFIAIKQVDDNDRAYALDVAYSPRSGWHDWSVYQGQVKIFYLVENKDADIPDDLFTFSTKQISQGSTGLDVFRLEVILKARGYYNGKLDSSFGPKLRLAVLAFQKAAGLAKDGICGPMTWATLLGLGSVNGRWIVEVVKLGDMHNKSVLLCQEALKALGYYDGKLDWNFGSATHAALVKFQKKANEKGAKLNTKGIFDRDTALYMYGAA